MKAIPTNSHAALQLVAPLDPPARVGSPRRRFRATSVVTLPSTIPATNQDTQPKAPAAKPKDDNQPRARLQKAKPKKKAGSVKAARVKPARQPQNTTGRPDSKKARVLGLLQRPQGATLGELRKATGWQSHSVRGFLSGIITKKMGLALKSEKREDGERVYSVRG